MPTKDLTGTPRDWRNEQHVLDMLRRIVPAHNWWPRFRDGGPEPIGVANPPRPKPLSGGAVAKP
jgi:hypothetical protein